MSDKRIVRIAFKLVINTKQLNHASTEWRNKADVDKERSKFKKHFRNAHYARKLTQTTSGDGFKMANNMEQAPEGDQQGANSFIDKMASAFANLLEATA